MLPLLNPDKPFTINIRGNLVSLARPLVMGILNATPDSFFSKSRVAETHKAVAQAKAMVLEGATILDIGGQSTRPNAELISAEEELKRVLPVIHQLRESFPEVLLSIDTFYSKVAKACVEAGAHLVNDVSGGERDPEMIPIVGELQVPYILMHSRGDSQTMMQLNSYQHLEKDIIGDLVLKKEKLLKAGVKDVIIDPGFGFAKNPEQGFRLLKNLSVFQVLDSPILVGLSRKSMIWKTLNTTADHALNGTTVLNTLALQRGATILRVHDVKQAVEAIKLWEKVQYSDRN